MSSNAIITEGLTFRYGERTALEGVSLSVARGELFGLIGPNGGGKSTLFKILSTLLKPAAGRVVCFGDDAVRHPEKVRRELGVVFQSPALDKKLTVWENLACHASLFGMARRDFTARADETLARFGLSDRKKEKVESLSGGLKRRLEIIKAVIPRPKWLLLDEPTTGLDPVARRQVWEHLAELNAREGLTVLVTTHLLDEAELCHRIALLDRGRVMIQGRPNDLKAELGDDVVTVVGPALEKLRDGIAAAFSVEGQLVGQELRLRLAQGHEFIPKLVTRFPGAVHSVTLGKPSLEDLFVRKTGRAYDRPSDGPEVNP